MDESTTGVPGYPDPPEGAPRRVGVYRLGRKIGEGGMGVVYHGTHETLKRPVAIKFIGHGRHSAEMRRRFEQERDVLSTLSHPAIATVFDAGEAEHDGAPSPYIVMEYVVGAETVRDACERMRAPMRRLLEMFEQLFDALEHAHSRGIVHRDITPRNILVDSEGRPKIIDFGLSLPRGGRGAVESLDAEGGRPAGTPAYMSPEQRTGDPHAIDNRTDLYSMALVFREVLSDAQARGEKVPAHVRGDLDAVMVSCLAKSPAERPERAADVRAALETIRERLIADVTQIVTLPGGRGPLPGALGWLAAGVAAAVSAFVVYPLLCSTLPFCSWYASAATAMLSAPGGDDPLARVRIVTLSLDMFDAEHLEVDGETPDIFAMRFNHADVLDALADSGVSAVGFDFGFFEEKAHDDRFAAAIRRSIERGVPVVLSDRFWPRPGADRMYAPKLLDAASDVACAAGQTEPDEPWKVAVASRLGDDFLTPSFATAIIGRVGYPDVQISLEADVEKLAVLLRRYRLDDRGRRVQVGPLQTIRVSGWTRVDEGGEDVGYSMDDQAATVLIDIPPDETLRAASIPYDRILDPAGGFDPESVRGRVVLVGRTDNPFDTHVFTDGRRIPGVYANAVAINTMLTNSIVRTVSDNVTRVLCGLAAAVGVGIVLAGRWSGRARWIAGSAACLIAVVACLAALPARQIVYPAPLLGSLLFGIATAAGLSTIWARRPGA